MVGSLKFFDPTHTNLSYYIRPGSNFVQILVVHSEDSSSKQILFP